MGLFVALLAHFCFQSYPIQFKILSYICFAWGLAINGPLQVVQYNISRSVNAAPALRVYARFYRVIPFIFGLLWVLSAVSDIESMSTGVKTVNLEASFIIGLYKALLWWNTAACIGAAVVYTLVANRMYAGRRNLLSIIVIAAGLVINRLAISIDNPYRIEQKNVCIFRCSYMALQCVSAALHTFALATSIHLLVLNMREWSIPFRDACYLVENFFPFYYICTFILQFCEFPRS